MLGLKIHFAGALVITSLVARWQDRTVRYWPVEFDSRISAGAEGQLIWRQLLLFMAATLAVTGGATSLVLAAWALFVAASWFGARDHPRLNTAIRLALVGVLSAQAVASVGLPRVLITAATNVYFIALAALVRTSAVMWHECGMPASSLLRPSEWAIASEHGRKLFHGEAEFCSSWTRHVYRLCALAQWATCANVLRLL